MKNDNSREKPSHDCSAAFSAGKVRPGGIDTLLFDCGNGARKSALVGSLIDLLDEDALEDFLQRFSRLGLVGISAKVSTRRYRDHGDDHDCVDFTVLKNGRTEAEVFRAAHDPKHAEAEHESHGSNDTTSAHHEHRSLSDVSYIIDTLTLDGKAAEDAIGIYEVLARAEAQAHDASPESVHFHEVGNDFAIAHVVAFSMLVNILLPRRIISTDVTTGFGFVNCAHGRVAIPAPATANILYGIPTKVGDVEGELTTPTGAAMISYFAHEFISPDEQKFFMDQKGRLSIGYGLDNDRFGTIRAIAQSDD